MSGREGFYEFGRERGSLDDCSEGCGEEIDGGAVDIGELERVQISEDVCLGEDVGVGDFVVEEGWEGP